MDTPQVIQTVVVLIVGAIVTAIVSLKKVTAEVTKGDRSDTFQEMKAMIEIARDDSERDAEKRSSERLDMMKKIDAVNQEHRICLEKAARLEEKVDSLKGAIDDLRRQLVQMRRAKGIPPLRTDTDIQERE